MTQASRPSSTSPSSPAPESPSSPTLALLAVILTVLLAFTTAIACVKPDPRIITISVVQPTPERLMASVRALQVFQSERFRNICTVSAIRHAAPEGKTYFLSADHCVASGGDYYIDGQIVAIEHRDTPNDLVILSAAWMPALPVLRLADAAPSLAQPVRVAGHPLGLPQVIYTTGHVSALSVDVGWSRFFTVFQVVGAPGNSGSAIVDEHNRVVSVLQIGWGQGFGPIVGGVQWEPLDALRAWFTGA